MSPSTLVGLIAVFIWGCALPVIRIIQSQIGALNTIGVVFTTTAVLGIANQLIRRRPPPPLSIFRSPYLYGRWIAFVGHEGFIYLAISIVEHQFVPFVILINYLWPTSTILCSMLLGKVRITHLARFTTGCIIVTGSLAFEIVGLHGVSPTLFDSEQNCLAFLIAFLGAVSWGMFSALSRKGGDQSGKGEVLPLFQATLGLSLLAPLYSGGAHSWDLTTGGTILLALYSIGQFIAFLSWDHGMRNGNVIILSLFADFIPWISLLAAHFLLAAPLHSTTIISALSLVVGAIITRRGTEIVP